MLAFCGKPCRIYKKTNERNGEEMNKLELLKRIFGYDCFLYQRT